jgi:uncharacterized protein (DUF58 family)
MTPPTPPDAQALLQHLEWTVLKRLDGLLHGDYRTLMRGFGLDLADLREYQPHDDVRTIDWNVTARMQTPYVREFQEDREVTVWLVVDLSASVSFGSTGLTKRALAVQAVAVLARLLTRHGNRVGALVFDGSAAALPRVIRPGTSRLHVLRLLHLLMPPAPGVAPATRGGAMGAQASPPAQTSWAARVKARWFSGRQPPQALAAPDLAAMLAQAQQQLRRRSVVLVVSDFISAPGWAQPLGALAQRHDVVAVQVADPAESHLPNVGMLTLQDAETGEQVFVDTSDGAFRRRFEAAAAQREASLAQGLASAGVDRLVLHTDQPMASALVAFAHRRKLRQRRLNPAALPGLVSPTPHAA